MGKSWRSSVRLIVSPYDIASRSIALVTGVLLSSREHGLATVIPAPVPNTQDRARSIFPQLSRFAEEMRWTKPYWECGLLRSVLPWDVFVDLFRRSSAELGELGCAEFGSIAADVSAESLSERFAADLIRGGDALVYLPVSAMLERLAAEHGSGLVSNGSTRQLTAEPAARALTRFELPVPKIADPRTLLALRGALAEPLEQLGTAIAAAAAGMDNQVQTASDKLARETAELVASNPALRLSLALVTVSWATPAESTRRIALTLERVLGQRSVAGAPSSSRAIERASPPFLRLHAKPSPWDFPVSAAGTSAQTPLRTRK